MEMLTILQKLFSVFGVNIAIALVTIAIIIWYSYSGATKNLPPGPRGLPILGYLPFLGKAPHETFNTLSKKYGPVFSLYLGSRFVVVLNNYDAIKEALVKQGEVFSGRPILRFTFADPDYYNIALADGEAWKVHRRFALNALRDLGLGKLSTESQIMEEIQYYVNELKKFNGRPTDFSELLLSSVSNNICILIFGKRFPYDDPWFISVTSLINEFVKVGSVTSVPTFFPWIPKLPGLGKIVNQEGLIMPKLSTKKDGNSSFYVFYYSFSKRFNDFKQSLFDRITEWKKHYTEGQRDNYINAFIEEQIIKQKKDKNDMMFSDRALEENIRGLIAAGTETTGNTLRWCIIYMATYPDVQKKVQKEIDDAIGTKRAPCWNDRLRTPYTEATLHEVQRMTTLLPTSLPHKNTNDCQLFGHTIPKDTFILPNLWAVHNDDKLWENPQSFRPERFLNAKGEAQKNEHLIPFSMGKRECLGISLAKMELYLYFATMLQKFTIKSPPGSTPSLESKIGFTNGPKYFNIMAVIRNTV